MIQINFIGALDQFLWINTTKLIETDFSFSGWTKYYFSDPIVLDLVFKCTWIRVALNQFFDFENSFLIDKCSIIDLL